jgi:quercetin 2,3-dioxygenase
MPAVTVDDLSALPSITLPSGDAASGPAARSRPVESITDAPAGFEGEGFPVHRAFAGVGLDPESPGARPGIPTVGSKP